MTRPPNMEPGAEVRLLRKGMGITQEWLAQLMGVSPVTVSRWECGIRKPGKHVLVLVRIIAEMHPSRTE